MHLRDPVISAHQKIILALSFQRLDLVPKIEQMNVSRVVINTLSALFILARTFEQQV